MSGPEWFLYIYISNIDFLRSLKRFWDCNFIYLTRRCVLPDGQNPITKETMSFLRIFKLPIICPTHLKFRQRLDGGVWEFCPDKTLKYRKVFNVAQKLASVISEKSVKEFHTHLQNIETLVELISESKPYLINQIDLENHQGIADLLPP